MRDAAFSNQSGGQAEGAHASDKGDMAFRPVASQALHCLPVVAVQVGRGGGKTLFLKGGRVGGACFSWRPRRKSGRAPSRAGACSFVRLLGGDVPSLACQTITERVFAPGISWRCPAGVQ